MFQLVLQISITLARVRNVKRVKFSNGLSLLAIVSIIYIV